jgi:hypothetical protein
MAYGGRDDKLFAAAAGESNSFGQLLTVEESQYQYDHLIKAVSCDKSKDTLKCLRGVDIKTLAKNNQMIPTPGGAGGNPIFYYGPVIDGDFIQDISYNALENGKFIKVPTIFGYAPLPPFPFLVLLLLYITALTNTPQWRHKRRHTLHPRQNPELPGPEQLPEKQLCQTHRLATRRD